jgi:hypothetical protein
MSTTWRDVAAGDEILGFVTRPARARKSLNMKSIRKLATLLSPSQESIYNLAFSLLDVLDSSFLKILGSLIGSDFLSAKHLHENFSNKGQHVLSLHASTMLFESPPRARSVESGCSVCCKEGKVRSDSALLRRRWVVGDSVHRHSNASAYCTC